MPMIAMIQSPLLCNTGLPIYSWSRYSSTSSSSISPRICLSSAWKKPVLKQLLIGALLTGVVLIVARALIERPPPAPAHHQQLCRGIGIPLGAEEGEAVVQDIMGPLFLVQPVCFQVPGVPHLSRLFFLESQRHYLQIQHFDQIRDVRPAGPVRLCPSQPFARELFRLQNILLVQCEPMVSADKPADSPRF